MSNLLHLILSAKDENLSDVLRNFKKINSKQLIKAIAENNQESRRGWMLRIFKEQGKKNSRNSDNQFWRQDNQPIELYCGQFIFSKAKLHS